MEHNCDFSGWATRNDLLCGDGRVIKKDAFKHNDGKTVSLVWNHEHNDPNAVLGHALLENRDEGVYAYCYFNDSETAKTAKELVQHGDVASLSIYANKLKQHGKEVLHGEIRELSLVLAGANPGAYIDFVMAHSDDGSEEEPSELYAGYNENIVLYHSGCGADDKKKNELEHSKEDATMADENKTTGSEETVADVFNTLSEKQKTVVYAMIGQALEDAGVSDDNEEDDNMKHNVFDNDNEQQANVLTHSDMQDIIADGRKYGSLKESFLAHTEEYGIQSNGTEGSYGIDILFPEPKTLNNPPEFIKRDTDWVQNVMGSVKHTPFSRIKSVFADITEDEARARGYIKGNLKKEEVFSLLKRTTTPCTIYKKQKLDRDDVIDITDFDVLAWIKGEMRLMLDEEIARAILVGDGRLSSSDDKINEDNIRPIWKDNALFTIKKKVEFAADDTDDAKAKKFIKAVVKARKDYKGSGNPTLYTTEDVLTDCLLMEDSMGRVIYDTEEKLRTALRVSKIVTVEAMENLSRTGVQAVDGDTDTRALMGIIVNLADYNVGADKGGAINMFDDFDIDYNQQKYLIETRCSGALIKPYSAIAIESVTAQAAG